MLPASNRGAGMNFCFPDTCLTPPAAIPVPYPNFAPHSLAMPFSPNVMICMLPALNILSRVVMTFGDEAGTMHPLYKQFGSFIVGAPNIAINMMPGVHLTLPTAGNGFNAPIGAHVIPNIVNVFFNFDTRAREVQGALTDDVVEDVNIRLRSEIREPTMVSKTVGLIPIAVFSADLPMLVFRAVRKLEKQGMRLLILDLRGCPGGELDVAVRLAGEFLHAGQEVVTVVDQDGDKIVHSVLRDGPYAMPLVLLVDGGTASAAEVFAQALGVHERATLMGQTTYGKTSVEAALWAANGPGMHYVAVGHCEGPVGVVPRVPVSSANDELILEEALRFFGTVTKENADVEGGAVSSGSY